MAELDPRQLDINERINLKAIVSGWTPIAIERLQEELAEKVYSSSSRMAKRKARRRKNPSRLSGNLLRDWRSRVSGDDQTGLLSSQISFLLYGKFVDMGVGNGIDAAEAKWRRTRKNGDPITRRAKRWLNRRKSYETHRLRELMARHYVNITVDSLESYLEGTITVHV